MSLHKEELIRILDDLSDRASGPISNVVQSYIGHIPILRLNLSVRLWFRKPVGPLSEFALRFIASGVRKREDLKSHLGIPAAMLTRLIVDLMSNDWISKSPGADGILRITSLGETVLKELTTIAEISKTLTFDMDPISRGIRGFSDSLINFSDANVTDDRFLILPTLEQRNDLDTLNKQEISQQLLKTVNHDFDEATENRRSGRFSASAFDRLCVEEILDSTWVFKRAPIFLMVDSETNEASIRVCKGWGDIEESKDHSEHLVASIMDNQVDLDIERPTEAGSKIPGVSASDLDAILRKNLNKMSQFKKHRQSIGDLREKKADINKKSHGVLGKTLGAAAVAGLDRKIQDEEKKLREVEESIQKDIGSDIKYRILTTEQHRDVLERALREARNQVIIISPWLRENALTKGLVQQLCTSLRRGVRVMIGYGIDEYDDEATQRALNRLNKAKQLGLTLKKLGQTHEKILVCDRTFIVITSFNWLSFRPWKGHALRMETGLYTDDPRAVGELAPDLEKRFL